jgi:multidrug efflux pump subunit AcrA (membrane-fusion protein)
MLSKNLYYFSGNKAENIIKTLYDESMLKAAQSRQRWTLMHREAEEKKKLLKKLEIEKDYTERLAEIDSVVRDPAIRSRSLPNLGERIVNATTKILNNLDIELVYNISDTLNLFI